MTCNDNDVHGFNDMLLYWTCTHLDKMNEKRKRKLLLNLKSN